MILECRLGSWDPGFSAFPGPGGGISVTIGWGGSWRLCESLCTNLLNSSFGFHTGVGEGVGLKAEMWSLIVRCSEPIVRVFEYCSLFRGGLNTSVNVIIRSSIVRMFE